MRQIETRFIAAGLVAAGLVLGTVALVSASSRAALNKKLVATAGAPAKAAGRESLNLHLQKNKGTKGSFTVLGNHLVSNSNYDVIVGGAKVGTLATNRGGNGRAAFSTSPHGRTALLGFDPRGTTVLLRDQTTGTDVLVGTVPDDTPGSVACCVQTGQTEDDGSQETECEDLLPADCTTAGGTAPTDATGAPITACLPDPCNNTTSTPPSTVATACCINTTHDEGSETECEDNTEAECAAAGGVVVQVPGVTPGDGNPCDANPCQATSPPSSPPAFCCVPHTTDSGQPEPAECEDLTADACTAAGGTTTDASGAPITSCDPNPCG